MTEEQIKFKFNLIYRWIVRSRENGVSFGDLVIWAYNQGLSDELFLWMIDAMEKDKLVVRQGETYMALEQAKHQCLT
jgi:hypothetical protein